MSFFTSYNLAAGNCAVSIPTYMPRICGLVTVLLCNGQGSVDKREEVQSKALSSPILLKVPFQGLCPLMSPRRERECLMPPDLQASRETTSQVKVLAVVS